MSSILRKLAFKSYQNCIKQSKRNLFGLTKSYGRILEKRPYLVQAVQSSILMGAGDLVAQTFFADDNASEIDYIRTLKFGSIGLFLTGPLIRLFYGILDKNVTAKSAVTRTLIKVGIDQFIFVPIFLVIFISTVSFLQKQSVEHIEHRLRVQYKDVLISNYYVWPWVQLVNFRWTPLNYQVLVTSTVALLWNVYVSWKTSKNLAQKLP